MKLEIDLRHVGDTELAALIDALDAFRARISLSLIHI